MEQSQMEEENSKSECSDESEISQDRYEGQVIETEPYH